MGKKIKGLLKNSKGFTLVELLAVIVILGIIAGIAVPSIGHIIENSRIDAHIANAKQIREATRLYVLSENITVATTDISTEELSPYLENMRDPFGGTYTYSVDYNPSGPSYSVTLTSSTGDYDITDDSNLDALSHSNLTK